MRFACENCQTRYTVADEKIRGRILKIRCRQCSAIMVVRDPELPPMDADFGPPDDSAESSRATPGPDETRQISVAAVQELLKASREEPLPTGDDATRVVSVASVQALLRETGEPRDPVERAEELRRAITGGGSGEEWWALAGGERLGPMSRQRLLDRVRDGTIHVRSYVWIDGMADWERLGSIESLAADLGIRPVSRSNDAETDTSSTEMGTDPEVEAAAADETAEVPSLSPVEEPAADTSAQDRILAAIAEEAGEETQAHDPAGSLAGSIATPPPRNQTALPWRTLRLAGAGALIAASFAAGAWFFVPEEGGREAPSGPIATGSRVVLADFELPDRAPLDRTAVGEALAARVPGFSRCVETHPPESGQRRILMRAVVAPSGAVTSASVSSAEATGDLGICLADRTRDIRFPPFKGEAVVLNFPLLLVGSGS